MQPYFRDAVGTDLTAIGALLNSSNGSGMPQPAPPLREALTDIDRTDGNYVLVAEFDRQIVAVLQLVAVRRLLPGASRVALIMQLGVAEHYQHSGVGEMLVDHAAKRARDLGCHRLEAISDAGAAREHAVWERCGFVHLDRGYVRRLT